MEASDRLDAASAMGGRPDAVRPRSLQGRILRALLSIASATLLVRVMGMGMQVVVTSRFGEGPAMDAYFIAAAVPLLVAGVIAAAMEASVVPVYTRLRTAGDNEQAFRLSSTLLHLVLIVAIVATLLMLVFRRQVVLLSGPAAGPVRLHEAAALAPVLFPVLVVTLVLALLESILNAEGQFGWPAFAGVLVPLSMAISVLVAGKTLGVATLGIGMLCGLGLQSGAFVLRMRRAKIPYRPVLDIHSPALGAVFAAAWPALLGSCIASVSPLVDQIFASALSAGNISALSYALRLIGVPTGVIFGAVAHAVLPYLSQQAAARDMRGFKATLRLYTWVIGIGTILSTILLVVLAHPLVRILFQRGAFSAADADRTAIILIGFAVGLLPMGLDFLLASVFSALGQTRVNMYASVFSVTTNAILDYFFARAWQGLGIALATSAFYAGGLPILLFTLRRMIGRLELLTPPPELLHVLHVLRAARPRRGVAPARPETRVPDRLRSIPLYIGTLVAASALGIAIAGQDALTALRLVLGLPIIAALLRYRYALLVCWVSLGALVGSNVPLFNGAHIDTALTAATLLSLPLLLNKGAFKRLPALALLLAYFLWMLLGIAVSPLDRVTFLQQWAIFLDLVPLAMLTITEISTRRRLSRFIDLALVTPTAIALYGIYGYVMHQNVITDPTGLTRITSVFDNGPALGLFLSIVAPLALYRVFTARKAPRLAASLVFCILLLALVLTFSRGAIASLALYPVIVIPLLPSRALKVGATCGALVLAALTAVLAIVGNVPIFSRFLSSDVTTLNGRTYLWGLLLQHFDPTQLLGGGLYAADVLLGHQHKIAPAGGTNPSKLLEAHSLFLATLYNSGIIGLTLLILMFVAVAVGLIAGMRQARGDHRTLFVMSFLTLVIALVQQVEGGDLFFQSIGPFFWVIIALPFAHCWSGPGAPATSMSALLAQAAPPHATSGRLVWREKSVPPVVAFDPNGATP